jgi:hypothetical protein
MMVLGRSAVVFYGLILLLVIAYTGQVITFLRSEAVVGIVDGHKDGKSYVKFSTGSQTVRVQAELPRYYITGDEARMIYDPAAPSRAEFYNADYRTEKQYLPMTLILIWLAFSLAYIGSDQVIVISLKKMLFRKTERARAEHFKGSSRELF